MFQVDSYGGSLKYKVSYLLQRDGSEPVDKPDVVLRGNGNRLVSRLDTRTKSNVKNEREVKFSEVSQSRHLTHLCINPGPRNLDMVINGVFVFLNCGVCSCELVVILGTLATLVRAASVSHRSPDDPG